MQQGKALPKGFCRQIQTLACLAVLFAGKSLPAQVSFIGGSEQSATLYKGRISFRCSIPLGPKQTERQKEFVLRTQFCRVDVLSGGDYQALRSESSIKADRVRITTQRANTSFSKEEDFDADAQQSEPFNLWISSVFQTPLLDFGPNELHYMFLHRGKPMSKGKFVVVVQDGGVKRCPSYHVPRTDPSLCRSRALACQYYWRKISLENCNSFVSN